jgi:hypothetical protein
VYNWREIEVRTGYADWEPIEAGRNARLRLEAEELAEEQREQRLSIRRRLAAALVGLGVKIDPQAAEGFATDEAA